MLLSAQVNDIEVYDKNGKDLGSMNPTTGEMYKPAVQGRTITINWRCYDVL